MTASSLFEETFGKRPTEEEIAKSEEASRERLKLLLAVLKDAGVAEYDDGRVVIKFAPPVPATPPQRTSLNGEQEDPEKMVDANERLMRTLLAATPFGPKR